MRLSQAMTWLVFSASPALAAAAGLTGDEVEEIVITGSDLALQGQPQTATEGVVFGSQLEMRPIARAAELLEFVPGLVATQHSGEGKGNQYFMRGFNLDHGTDLAIDVDGVPVNMPTHGHGHGYADLNFMIPEMVDALDYRKGPYYAGIGDFGTAGSAEFEYFDRLPRGRLAVTTGEHGYRRAFAGNTFGEGRGALTLAAAATNYDGPWELEQDVDKRQALVKYHHEAAASEWSLTGMSYDNDWNATDQIPARAVESGRISRWGFIDDSDGGASHRHSLSFDWQHEDSSGSAWAANAWLLDYGLDLYSNFTYAMENPGRGDQFEQVDDRQARGGELEFSTPLSLPGRAGELRAGLQYRRDDIDVGLHRSERRQRYATIREDSVQQSMNSAYLALQQRWTSALRSVASLRLDHYRYDVNANMPVNSGEGSESLLSPKLNLIYRPIDHTEYFFSVGRGFHSNDARGATTRIDPTNGEPVSTVDPLAAADSMEVGMRSAWLPRTQVSVTAFAMDLESELVFVGDVGNTEALNGSRRYGIEMGALYSPLDWLLIDGDLALTRARLRHAGSDDRIPNSVSRVASLGLTIDNESRWSGGLRLRYLGEAPLTESGQPRSDSTFLVNAQAGYQLSERINASLSIVNLFDSKDQDISYFYESQLPGESQPVADHHFHPAEPRMLRLTLEARL